MPYIKMIERHLLHGQPNLVNTVGQLNYLVTLAALDFERGKTDEEKSIRNIKAIIQDYVANAGPVINYQIVNDVVGALMCASLELGRRLGDVTASQFLIGVIGNDFYDEIAAPYEDGKIIENGDVYDVGE